MSSPRVLACTLCGECEPGNQRWFLLTEDLWQDKLRILHWDDYLAAQEGMHCACSAAHLQQLVIHWTTTGSLDHPFAKSHSGLEMVRRPRRGRMPGSQALSRSGSCRFTERVCSGYCGRTQSLQTILDALLSALQKETPRPEPKIDWAREAVQSAPPEV